MMWKVSGMCALTLSLATIFGNAVRLSRLPESDDAQVYTFVSTVVLNEVHVTAPETVDVGHKITGEVRLSRIWQNASDALDRLYHVRISELKLLAKKRHNDRSKFDEQTTKLETVTNDPFLVHWNNYRVEKIYLNRDELETVKNLKKAIASVFQFREFESQADEIDVSGLCSVTYEKIDERTILKRKKDCISRLPANRHPEKIFGAEKIVERKVLYSMNENSTVIKISSYESVDFSLSIKRMVGVSVVGTLDLNFSGTVFQSITMLPVISEEEAAKKISDTLKTKLQPESLYLTRENEVKKEKSLTKLLKEKREYLREKNLGTHESAVAFLEILRLVIESSEVEIIKTLKNKKNEPIMNQLMDILGSAQTLPAHNAVLKTFDFLKPENIDPLERYLWAISIGRKSKIEFLYDVKKIIERKPSNEKLKETLLLTLTALAPKFSPEVQSEVYSFIVDSLSKCDSRDDPCIALYLRTIKNLKHPEAKSILLKYAGTGSRLLSVSALKVLYSFPPSEWDEEVLKTAEKIYYQKDKIYDSSARTIAVDIIIDSNPDRETLRNLLNSLQTNTSYEARKYLLQRLQQTASMDQSFGENLKALMTQENLHHYGFLAQKGLSNALTKTIFSDTDLNASIFNINEISKSVLKRGHVSVTLSQQDSNIKVCALDLFTGGLSSFLWSEDVPGEEELEEAENLIAGMELTVYGVAIRPFLFFNGHAELMGHIWAGTASERTSILQAMGLLQEHYEYVALVSGNVLKFDLLGGSSFELAGQVQFSIWNRNAHAKMDSKVGAVIEGSATVDTFFVKNAVNFKVYSEQNVEVMSDLDFYDEVLFCLRISQMPTIAKYDVDKFQIIEKGEHTIRRRKRRKLILPGRTFALNQKNNEMCNTISKNTK